jgi:hypothetical protein
MGQSRARSERVAIGVPGMPEARALRLSEIAARLVARAREVGYAEIDHILVRPVEGDDDGYRFVIDGHRPDGTKATTTFEGRFE